MKREILGRLTALEGASATRRKIDENDPHVIAYRNRPSALAELLEQVETGVSPADRLEPRERVKYWADKVTEAELLISTGGRDEFDDLREVEMSPTTVRILRELSLDIAQRSIDDYRAELAKAQHVVSAN